MARDQDSRMLQAALECREREHADKVCTFRRKSTRRFDVACERPAAPQCCGNMQSPEVRMRACREIAFLVALALHFSGGASAQTTPAKTQKESRETMKATAPDKMMPAGEGRKMRECEKRAQRQKIKMADRAGFVDRCVAREVN
jgi:hypothetical protein